MRKIIYSAALLSTLLVAGCTDKLELQPEQSLSNELALNSYSKVLTALYGTYDGLQLIGYYGRDFPVMADANSDDIVIGGSNSGRFLRDNDFQYSAEYGSETEFSQGFWNSAYRTIARANNVISAVDNIPDGSDADKNQVLGEALFVRALAHFDLVRRYAQPFTADNGAGLGVPYVKVVEIGEPARNTVAEVYAEIIADLTQAESLMTQATGPFRANKGAVAALLSRVYLYQGANQKAVDAANRAATGKSLVPKDAYVADWAQDNSPESFFEVKFQPDENRGANNYGYIYTANTIAGYGDLRPSEGIIDLLADNDIRKQFIRYVEGEKDDFNYKFGGQVGGIAGLISPRVLRLSEVILNRAEAHAKLGNNAEALADLNLIRTRAGLDAITSTANLLDEILEERRRELMFEGHRFYDLMRNGRDLVRQECGAVATSGNACTLRFGDHRVAYPIPQRELDANPNMVQNPGYVQ